MKDVQCYELFGGIAPKNHALSFFISHVLQTSFLSQHSMTCMVGSSVGVRTYVRLLVCVEQCSSLL